MRVTNFSYVATLAGVVALSYCHAAPTSAPATLSLKNDCRIVFDKKQSELLRLLVIAAPFSKDEYQAEVSKSLKKYPSGKIYASDSVEKYIFIAIDEKSSRVLATFFSPVVNSSPVPIHSIKIYDALLDGDSVITVLSYGPSVQVWQIPTDGHLLAVDAPCPTSVLISDISIEELKIRGVSITGSFACGEFAISLTDVTHNDQGKIMKFRGKLAGKVVTFYEK